MTRPAHVPDHLVVDYDAFGAGSTEEMLERVDEWRSIGPVLWTDRNGGHWLLVSHAANRYVLTNPETFPNGQGTAVTPMGPRAPMVPLELDGDEHVMYRKLLNPLFAPGRVRLLEDNARTLARSLLDDIAPRGECDVVADYARPLASNMFLRLVDFPASDRHMLEEMVERELNAPGATPEELQQVKAQAIADILAYCKQQVERRRLEPTDDMTMTLMNAEVDGQPIPDVRLISMLLLLMLAGLDTTQSVTSRSMAQLAADPDLQRELRDEPAQIPMRVEEFLRYGGPAGPNRAAAVDTEIEGVEVRAGQRVHCMLQAANRDPNEFPEPNDIVLDRPVNRHLTFGVGPHKCIGAALARVVLNVALDELHQRLPEYELVDQSSHLGGVWGMDRVVIRFDPVTTTT